MAEKVVVLTCGGGSGAHCLAGLAATKPDLESRVLNLYCNKVEQWAAMSNLGLLITVRNDDGSKHLIQTKPFMVTKTLKTLLLGLNTSSLSFLLFLLTKRTD